MGGVICYGWSLVIATLLSFIHRLTKLKIPPEYQGDIYMDGLVSTGNKFPNTILEIIFINQKIFSNYFINILILPVDKRT